MTDAEPDRLDNPNQEVVRPDGSGPADEGSGAGKPAKATPRAGAAKSSTKAKDKDDPPAAEEPPA